MANASSNNIQPAEKIAPYHNDRSIPPHYILGSSEKNKCTRSAIQVMELIQKYDKERIGLYEESVKQKFQKSTKKVVEAAVNFDSRHSLQDMINVASFMAIKYGFTILQIAMHYDEGVFVKDKGLPHEKILEPGKDIFYKNNIWFDQYDNQITDPLEDGFEVQLNLHAHILMHNLRIHKRIVKRSSKNKEDYTETLKPGTTIFQKLSVSELRTLQTETAEILNMKRGEAGNKRKKSQDLKEEKRQVSKAKQEVHKNYQDVISKYQNELELLRNQNERLIIQEQSIISKDNEIKELKKKVDQHCNHADLLSDQIQKLLQKLEVESEENSELLNEIDALKQKIHTLEVQSDLYEEENNTLKIKSDYFEEDNDFLLEDLGIIDGMLLGGFSINEIINDRKEKYRDYNEVYSSAKNKQLNEAQDEHLYGRRDEVLENTLFRSKP